MYHAGGPILLLDRRASSPRTPGCLVPSQTTPEIIHRNGVGFIPTSFTNCQWCVGRQFRA